MSAVRVSVVIPTWRRPAALQRALLSLENQTFRAFAVVVVDNAGQPEVAAIVDRTIKRGRLRIAYVAEPALGLHHARHRGAQATESDLLVFTDDDATFSPGWLDAYVSGFAAHPGMAAASGPVRPVWASPAPAWLARYAERGLRASDMFPPLSLLERGPELRISPREVLFGVNMAIRRSELIAHGGFSPEIFGETWLGDGESGLNRRLTETGRPIGYLPDAVVHHHIEESRMTMAYLRRRMRNEGAAHVFARLRGAQPSRARLASFLVRGVALHWPLILASIPARGITRSGTIRIQLAAAHRIGRIEYAWRLLKSARLRSMVAEPTWRPPLTTAGER